MKRGKRERVSVEEQRATLFAPTTSVEEREEIVLSLLAETSQESYRLLGDYLLWEEPGRPAQPIMNFKAEVVSGLKVLVVQHFMQGNPTQLTPVLIKMLQAYYSYEELRVSILKVLQRFGKASIAAQQVMNQVWQEALPSSIAALVFDDCILYLPENEAVNHTYWFLFTPEHLTHDFPTKFHPKVFEHLVKLKGKDEALFMLVHCMVDELNKRVVRWSEYVGDYLKAFSEDAFKVLRVYQASLVAHPSRAVLVEKLQFILEKMSQADDESFLRSFSPDQSGKEFLKRWMDHIDSRRTLRDRVLLLLRDLGDPEAAHELELTGMVESYNSATPLRELLDDFQALDDLAAVDESFVTKIEVLLLLLEWKFRDTLVSEDFSRLDLVRKLLGILVDLSVSTTKEASALVNLLATTAKEATNQYIFRKSVAQQIFSAPVFEERLVQREQKYHTLEAEPSFSLGMKFNMLADLEQQQKKRFLQFLFRVEDQHLVTTFVDKLNDVLSRIYQYPQYFVVYRLKLKLFDPAQRKDNTTDDSLTDKLITFYRYLEWMMEQELQWKRFTVVAYRRVDAVIDLVNDFISYDGLVDFEPSYVNTEQP